MELSRKEYPAMLDSLQPTQAVSVLNERMKYVSKLNSEIADWLQERRRVEELYVQGLRKLANRQLPEDSPDLGVFATPWRKIVSSCESVAESHQILAQKIETDIERPLREFSSTNRDMQAMTTISGNLASMAKDIEASQKKADKLKLKGEKAAAGKVASATSEVENAQSQWDSQAPYVFEKLQDVDESRCDRLRDLLTQFQTHEVDQVERNRVSAEDCLNAILNIETADEIKTWAAKVISGKPKLERSQLPKPPSSSGGGLAPPPTTPSRRADDDSSQRSGSTQEQKSSGLHGLNRFKTVLGRRRQSTLPYPKGASPERKTSATNLGSSFFGKGKNKDSSKSADRPGSPSRRLSEQRSQTASRASDMSSSPKQARQSADKPNGTTETNEAGPSSDLMNGTKSSIPELQEPLQPSPPTSSPSEVKKDAEGFSIPSTVLDAISQAEKEAKEAKEGDSTTEAPTQQFKVDIRNAPIPEEDAADAENAIANVANTLRAQAAPLRKSGTIRGRRAGDVRNTMFIPSDTPIPGLPSAAATNMVAVPTSPPLPQPSPLLTHRSTFASDYTGSDTQSVRSGRSLSSYASATVRHPDMHEPGLNSSIVETVSTWFENGQITKAMVIGQVALAFNPIDLSSPFGTDTIRLENFPVLEKVAPNPAFLEQVPEKPGTYTVDLSKITKTSVAFHYQVHLENSNIAVYSPIVISPAWKIEPTQTSAIINYTLNSAFTLPANVTSITLSNLIIVLRLDSSGARATNAQSKPVGSFARERSLIYWRLGDVTFSLEQPAHQLRVRFFTDGEAKPGSAEARWEVAGDSAKNFGSGLAVSKIMDGQILEEKEKDPFADEEGTNDKEGSEKGWKEVPAVKKICSGTYLATQ